MKGLLKLEIEKLQADLIDADSISENGSLTNDSIDIGDRLGNSAFPRYPSTGIDGPRNTNHRNNAMANGKEVNRNRLNGTGNYSGNTTDVSS